MNRVSGETRAFLNTRSKSRAALIVSQTIRPLIVMLGLLLILAGCNEDDVVVGRGDLSAILSTEEVTVTRGESVDVTVDIDGPDGVTVNSFNVDVLSDQSKIDITISPCPAGVGTPSCEIWNVAPRLDAIPARHFMTIEPNAPSTLDPGITRQDITLEIDVLNHLSAPPAARIFGSGPHHVLSTGGRKWSWGANFTGEAGVGLYVKGFGRRAPGFTFPSSPPSNSFTRWRKMDNTVTGSIGFAIDENEDLYSWGSDNLALGYVAGSPVPIPRQVPAMFFMDQAATVNGRDSAGNSSRAAVAVRQGDIVVWGSQTQIFRDGSESTNLSGGINFHTLSTIDDVVEIATGDQHILALRDDGTVWSWGRNDSGQLGLGNTDHVNTPTLIIELSNITQISAAQNYSFALRDDGTVWAWGENRSEYLGFGTLFGPNSVLTPQQIPGLNNISKIAAVIKIARGDAAAQAIEAGVNGGPAKAWIWGRDHDSTPIVIPGLEPIDVAGEYVVDNSCSFEGLPAGFVWDVQGFPGKPKLLLPTFGKNDPNCPNTLFIDQTGQGTVTVSPGGCSPDGCSRHTYAQPTSVQITATPATGWMLDPVNPWKVAGVYKGSSADCLDGTVDVQGGVQCIAQFIRVNSRKVTIEIQGAGRGSVTSNPAGITCGNTCSSFFQLNTIVVLTPLAETGSTFAGWSSSAPEAICRNGAGILNRDATCVAAFDLESTVPDAQLTVATSGAGTGFVASSNVTGIDCGTDCDEVYANGTTVTLVAAANTGSQFAGWTGTGDCATAAMNSTITVTMNDDTQCTANFDSAGSGGGFTLTLTINGGPGAGEIRSTDSLIPTMQCINSSEPSTTCMAVFAAGENVELLPSIFGTATEIIWTGCDQAASVEGCFLIMNGDRTITATFQ